ncbi:ABC-type Fe3+-hydroxamate transport system substrate-binding protein [Saccharothrix tamanrassetensis]|uniref:ABC-type Fe3+-hydroxamate transport system substrate-binding protein n=1 Tax=Saccharothrix tamanrassetensis TaxID=1051531 RepID=A0A841CJ88_9PSEU|nr:helical backbone metal receptor [Saccharothrix tamanrassetensis]MBB5956075.1 ABC-type Fe3+-hydroxamate transport system substrate-binding protein [Saccharothrix tamanrassetensis]
MLPVDDLGEPVALPGPPRRVVSLVPSLTEAVDPAVLVGATDYCTHPADLDVTRVGGSKYPKVDRVLELAPDLVLANSEENRPEDVERLRANGIPVWVTAAPATVPAALGSLRRLLGTAWDVEPGWLVEAERVWREVRPARFRAVIPVWRKPWVVIGRDTFAGDVLHRLGVVNVYVDHAERYPRPDHDELQSVDADVVVLPDEPYLFTPDDGPQFFPRLRPVYVSGRYLTWYGPSLVAARGALEQAFGDVGR